MGVGVGLVVGVAVPEPVGVGLEEKDGGKLTVDELLGRAPKLALTVWLSVMVLVVLLVSVPEGVGDPVGV